MLLENQDSKKTIEDGDNVDESSAHEIKDGDNVDESSAHEIGISTSSEEEVGEDAEESSVDEIDNSNNSEEESQSSWSTADIPVENTYVIFPHQDFPRSSTSAACV